MRYLEKKVLKTFQQPSIGQFLKKNEDASLRSSQMLLCFWLALCFRFLESQQANEWNSKTVKCCQNVFSKSVSTGSVDEDENAMVLTSEISWRKVKQLKKNIPIIVFHLSIWQFLTIHIKILKIYSLNELVTLQFHFHCWIIARRHYKCHADKNNQTSVEKFHVHHSSQHWNACVFSSDDISWEKRIN